MAPARRMRPLSVLLITEDVDVHCHAMKWALAGKGVSADIWPLATFPEKQRLSVRIPAGHRRIEAANSLWQSPQPYTSIWLRRLTEPGAISEHLAKEDVQMALLESTLFLDGLRPVLASQATLINPLESRHQALSKQYQLLVARESGFIIPETLVSNDPREIRKFFREHRGNIIYKPFHQAGWRAEAEKKSYMAFAARLTEEQLADDVSITSCPGIYQSYVEKKSELRITFFGDEYYVVRIYSQETPDGRTDWRANTSRDARLEIVTPETALLDRCRAFVRRMNLLHGSFDIVEPVAGPEVFLEVNEMGQFLWLETKDTPLPLLAAAAAFACEPDAAFRFNPAKWKGIDFFRYVESENFADFKKIWDRYMEERVFPFVYQE